LYLAGVTATYGAHSSALPGKCGDNVGVVVATLNTAHVAVASKENLGQGGQMKFPKYMRVRHSTPCDHRRDGGKPHPECFHEDCLVDMTFADGSYLLLNRRGHVRRVEEDAVVRA